MGYSEKDRLTTTVVDLWCSFQYELAGDKRKYPMREFFSFASACPYRKCENVIRCE